MKKPILIDALHICLGGGLMILNHLVNHLVERNVNFVLLKDSRCPELESEKQVLHLETLPSDNKTRNAYYRTHRNDFSSVLCFGNLPPQIKMPVPVHTYIHNVSLLKIPQSYPLKRKALSHLKRLYLKLYSKNTTDWIVQTTNTANLVKKNLATKNQPIFLYPFFRIPDGINVTPKHLRNDYCFIGNFTYAKGHEYLVDAWVTLAQIGINPTLHLTVSFPAFIEYINKARQKGANIVNHGKLPFSKVIEIYNQSKAIIYPSLNESLGLGIIEGIEAGCDIIGADLPYMHSVCLPSELFKHYDSQSIVDAVLRYESGDSPSTVIKIKDEVDAFISFLE